MKKKNRVGLGTFPLASVFTKVTNKQAEEIVKAFIDEGGYYIDVAPIYGFGKVEQTLGKILKAIPRNQYFLMTKCGWVGIESKKLAVSSKKEDILRECDNSLKRLSVDYIDLYFVHLPDPDTPFKETMKTLLKLKKKGKIRQIGVSNVSLCELKEYQKYGRVDYVQNRFSSINRSIDSDFAKYLLKERIGLIPYQVIERGC
jgi:aryl-alcohol dehydrogenase-like predicted oxidoreductase